MRSKRRDQYQSDNRETNDKLNPLYTLSTMINIFHGKEVFNSRFSVIRKTKVKALVQQPPPPKATDTYFNF